MAGPARISANAQLTTIVPRSTSTGLGKG